MQVQSYGHPRQGNNEPANTAPRKREDAMDHSPSASVDRAMQKTSHENAFRALLDGRVLLMCFYYVAFPLSAYGLSYWLPTIVQDFGVSNTANGFINIIPWIVVALALWFHPRWAAKSGQE